MWRYSMTLLSKTKSEPMMHLFFLVKNNLWKARGVSNDGYWRIPTESSGKIFFIQPGWLRMLRWTQVELGRPAWSCCKRYYPQSAMCIWKHMHHAQSDGCPQHWKYSPRTTLTLSILPGKWWTLSPKDEVKVQTFSSSDQQTVPNHSCLCHWASCLTAFSVRQTLSLTLSPLSTKRLLQTENGLLCNPCLQFPINALFG